MLIYGGRCGSRRTANIEKRLMCFLLRLASRLEKVMTESLGVEVWGCWCGGKILSPLNDFFLASPRLASPRLSPARLKRSSVSPLPPLPLSLHPRPPLPLHPSVFTLRLFSLIDSLTSSSLIFLSLLTKVLGDSFQLHCSVDEGDRSYVFVRSFFRRSSYFSRHKPPLTKTTTTTMTKGLEGLR